MYIKKAFSVILVLALVITAVPLLSLPAFAADWKGLLYYEKINNGTAIAITDYGEELGESLSIPATIGGLPVTRIGNEAFCGCWLISITIPASVTSIGTDAFWGCESLTKINVSADNKYFSSADGVLYNKTKTKLICYPAGKENASYTLPAGVSSISAGAFSYNMYLESIGVNSSNKYFTAASGVLFNKAKTTLVCYPMGKTSSSYTIPSTVTSIGYEAFYSNMYLEKITFPSTLKTIGYCAFSGSFLTSVTLPSGVTSIEEYAFLGCFDLAAISLPNTLTNIGFGAFLLTAYYQTTSRWNNKVLYIGKNLITADTELTGNYTVASGTTCIADGAFFLCDTLTSVTIPQSVTVIGDEALNYCSSLTAVNVDANNANYTAINGVLFNKAATQLITYPYNKQDISYVIPDGVKSIGISAFFKNNILKTVTLSDSVTSIGIGTFSSCTALQTIILSDNLGSIGNYAFDGCEALTSVLVPSVAPAEAVDNGDPTPNVVFPKALKTVGTEAFLDCALLKTVALSPEISSIGSYAFGFTSNTEEDSDDTLYSPVSGFSIASYQYSTGERYAINNGLTYKSTAMTDMTINTAPTKTAYGLGDTLSVSGLKLNTTYADETTHIITSGYTYTPTTLYTAGTQAVTVACGSFTDMFTVNVIPKTPTGVKAVSASYNSIKISWTAVPGTVKYAVYRSATKTGTYAYLKSSTSTSVTDTSLKTGTTYYYKVKAYQTVNNVNICSTESAIVYAKPELAIPGAAKAVSASYNSIKITWTAVADATGYYVYRSATKDGTYTYLKSSTSASVTDTSLKTGTMYYYKVKAYKTVGGTKYNSAYSAIVSAKPVPATPGSFTAAKASSTSIKLTWKAVSGASGYCVYRATSSTGTFTYVKSTTSLSFTNTGLTKNKTYYYKIRAYRTVNNTKVYGAYTAIKSAKPY